MGLLVAGSLAAIGGISAANFFLFFALLNAGLLIAVPVTVAAVFGITRLRGVFERHYGMSYPRFGLLAFVPSIAVSGIFFIVMLILDGAGYFSGFFEGLLESLYAFGWLLTSGAAAFIGAIMLAVSWSHNNS